jgi:hypothetical protein
VWFVGEHMQVRRLRTPEAGDETLTDWAVGDPAPTPASLMRAGKAER